MADAKKKEVPAHIKEFYDRTQSIENIINNTRNVHSDAYVTATSVLKGENDKHPVYSKLDDEDIRNKFIDKLIDSYLQFAIKESGSNPQTSFEKDVLLQKYVGITRQQLAGIVEKEGSNYTIDTHEKLRESLVKEQEKKLRPLASGHLKDEHIDDILEHTGTKQYFNKNVLELEKAASLLGLYKNNGEIGIGAMRQLKDQFGGDAYFTTDTIKQMKNLKDNYKKGN